MEKMKKDHDRVNDILLGFIERPALEFFCKHMPKWVNPDHLTVLGVLAGFLIGISYFLTSYDKNFLWLASVGLVIHWFGDSLDGNLARYRKIERQIRLLRRSYRRCIYYDGHLYWNRPVRLRRIHLRYVRSGGVFAYVGDDLRHNECYGHI